MIRIALRLDDPSPASDHELERGILAVLKELEIPATFAVVPFAQVQGELQPLHPENVLHLVEAYAGGRIEVAQHGYAHECMTASGEGAPSEFWRVPTEEQARRIDAGRIRLEQVFNSRITGFVPPWNTFDATTAGLLAERGYTYLSGSLSTPPDRSPAFRLIPRSTDIHHLRQAHAEASRRPFFPSTIVAIMHHYDFRETAANPGKLSLADFRATLAWLKDQPSVRFTTLSQLALDFSVAGSWSMYARHVRKSHLHWRLQRLLPHHQLYTRPLLLHI